MCIFFFFFRKSPTIFTVFYEIEQMYSFCYNTHSLQINARLLASISSSPEATQQGLEPELPVWIKGILMSECDEKDISSRTQANTNISQATQHHAKLEEVFKSKVSQIRQKSFSKDLKKRLDGLFWL